MYLPAPPFVSFASSHLRREGHYVKDCLALIKARAAEKIVVREVGVHLVMAV